MIQAAGKVLDPKDESTGNCLTFDTRPTTPEDVRRYRKSYFAEPGARIAHPGLINDLKAIDPLTKFGVVTTGSQHVQDVLPNAPASDYQRIALAKSEANYASHKREPLGKSYVRGFNLPQHMQKPEFAFGISGTFGESAKELLYPTTTLNSKQDTDMYKRSHGSVAPGEQKNREYQWDNAQIDPKKHRFGVKTGGGGALGSGEVATCLNPEMDESISKQVVAAKQVEDMRSTFDHLGKPRHIAASSNLPSDHIFGASLKKDGETAWAAIQGNYSADEQQPDADLGRAVNFGWKNVAVDNRLYGIPTIRSDIPAPARRSMADSQNYGDDTSSKELLYPETFASYGVKDDEFAQPRDPKQLRRLFESIGHKLGEEEFALVWKLAALAGRYTPKGCASVAEFRDALNDLLAAQDNGQAALQEWHDRVHALR